MENVFLENKLVSYLFSCVRKVSKKMLFQEHLYVI